MQGLHRKEKDLNWILKTDFNGRNIEKSIIGTEQVHPMTWIWWHGRKLKNIFDFFYPTFYIFVDREKILLHLSKENYLISSGISKSYKSKQNVIQ